MSWNHYIDYLKAGGACNNGFILDSGANILASSYELPSSELPTYSIKVLDPKTLDSSDEYEYNESKELL